MNYLMNNLVLVYLYQLNLLHLCNHYTFNFNQMIFYRNFYYLKCFTKI